MNGRRGTRPDSGPMSAGAVSSGDAALLALALAGGFAGRRSLGRPLVYGGSLAISAALLVVALVELLGGAKGEALVLPLGLPWLGARFHIDALSAFFLVVVNLGGAVASLYALGYGRREAFARAGAALLSGLPRRHEPGRCRRRRLHVPADMGVDVACLVGAGDGPSSRRPDNARAGYVYLVMASFGTLACYSPSALLAGPNGGYGFAAMRAGAAAAAACGAGSSSLALLGAGSKAGLVPLHVWLPLAHPAAPSHVSALMSGVMTKVAVYAFIRIVFDLAGPPAWWLERSGAGRRRGDRR